MSLVWVSLRFGWEHAASKHQTVEFRRKGCLCKGYQKYRGQHGVPVAHTREGHGRVRNDAALNPLLVLFPQGTSSVRFPKISFGCGQPYPLLRLAGRLKPKTRKRKVLCSDTWK